MHRESFWFHVQLHPFFHSLANTILLSLSIPQCTPCGSIRHSHHGHPQSWSWQIPRQSGSFSVSFGTDSTPHPTGRARAAPQWRPIRRRWRSISGSPPH